VARDDWTKWSQFSANFFCQSRFTLPQSLVFKILTNQVPVAQLAQATRLKKPRFLRHFQGFLRFCDLQSPARFGTLLPSFSAKFSANWPST